MCQTSQPGSGKRVRIKLPKLELKKFSGKIHEWQEFLDSFRSAIYNNEDIAKVDKFKYLRSFLEEPARGVITGFALTDADYDSAVDLLTKRFARPSVIRHAHINEMANLSPVFNEQSVGRLHHFHDQIEAHYRGLEALGVDKQFYSSIVVPLLMTKLPDSVRMNMIRFGENHLEWTLDEFISSLSREVEIRESYTPIFKPGSQDKTEKTAQPNKQEGGLPSAAAFFTAGNNKNIVNCAFCKKEHKSEDCDTVKDPEERKKILLKSAKCFMCFKSGHRAFQCRNETSCSICSGKHHSILCSSVSQTQDKELPAQPNAPPLNPNASSWLVGSISSASKERVALQTALANVEGRL